MLSKERHQTATGSIILLPDAEIESATYPAIKQEVFNGISPYYATLRPAPMTVKCQERTPSARNAPETGRNRSDKTAVAVLCQFTVKGK
jgi:hypothetical protein